MSQLVEIERCDNLLEAQQLLDVLVAAGVDCETWRMPAELGERKIGLNVISHDDVLDFHDLLNTPDWFVTLATMTEG